MFLRSDLFPALQAWPTAAMVIRRADLNEIAVHRSGLIGNV